MQYCIGVAKALNTRNREKRTGNFSDWRSDALCILPVQIGCKRLQKQRELHRVLIFLGKHRLRRASGNAVTQTGVNALYRKCFVLVVNVFCKLSGISTHDRHEIGINRIRAFNNSIRFLQQPVVAVTQKKMVFFKRPSFL